ncbi:Rv2231c family pyridoxal phosphate-dependent protein CobC [Glycomyces tarimensis]
MTLHLILGGARSGKSARAERLAAASGRPVAYLATGSPSDPEMAERVRAHRQRRPAAWRTLETTDLAAALRELPPETCALIDDLDGWVTDEMTLTGLWADDEVAGLGTDGRAAWDRVLAAAAEWRDLAAAHPAPVIVVAGQAGGGLTPTHASSRRWLDLHGDVVRQFSEAAGECELVVAGRPMPLPAPTAPPEREDRLREHGDTQVPEGAVDLAVNVLAGPPEWLAERLSEAAANLAAYPDQGAARAAAAARHGRTPAECLLLNGAAEGFWLLAQTLRPRHAVCVHPTFTEGEAALRAAGVRVTRVFRDSAQWTFDPAGVPHDADFVLLTRPDNPTGTLDPVATVERLCRPGRTVVVDEAFADFLTDGADLAGRGDLPGLVAVRSLTKLWGIAGLRVGYLLADAATIARLDAARQPWPVSSLALAAIEACAAAEDERAERARRVDRERETLLQALDDLPGLRAWPAAANFVLVRTDQADLRERLLADGLALRRGDTFPGLDRHYLRIAVRDEPTTDRLRTALLRHLKGAT